METSGTLEITHPAQTPNTDAAADAQQLNPLAQSAGLLRDDPFFEEMMESIRRHRAEMDAEWDETGEARNGHDPAV